MTARRFGQQGFTLMEVIVVLAVIAALSAVLVPVVFRYIDDARKGQAQSDVNIIAAAINQMYKDTGRWPFYASGTSTALKKASGDFDVLTSNSGVTAAAALSTDTAAPGFATGITGWAATLKVDSLADQLITNNPGYATSTSGRAWKGPYLDKIPSADPWTKSYLVNIGQADPANESVGTQKWTIVISAGPNGVLDTNGDTVSTANPSAAGDDIVARVK